MWDDPKDDSVAGCERLVSTALNRQTDTGKGVGWEVGGLGEGCRTPTGKFRRWADSSKLHKCKGRRLETTVGVGALGWEEIEGIQLGGDLVLTPSPTSLEVVGSDGIEVDPRGSVHVHL